MPGQNPFDDFVDMIGSAAKPVAQAGDWMSQHPPMEYFQGLMHGLVAMHQAHTNQQQGKLGQGQDVTLPPDPKNAKRMARKGKPASSMGNAAASLPGIKPPMGQ